MCGFMITNVASTIRTVKYMWQSGREKEFMLGLHDHYASEKLRGQFDHGSGFDRSRVAHLPAPGQWTTAITYRTCHTTASEATVSGAEEYLSPTSC